MLKADSQTDNWTLDRQTVRKTNKHREIFSWTVSQTDRQYTIKQTENQKCKTDKQANKQTRTVSQKDRTLDRQTNTVSQSVSQSVSQTDSQTEADRHRQTNAPYTEPFTKSFNVEHGLGNVYVPPQKAVALRRLSHSQSR